MAAQGSHHSLLLQRHHLATPPHHTTSLHQPPHTVPLLPHIMPLPLQLLPHIQPQSRRILLPSRLTPRLPRSHIPAQATLPPPTSTSPTSSQLTIAAYRRRRWRLRSVKRLQNGKLDLMKLQKFQVKATTICPVKYRQQS